MGGSLSCLCDPSSTSVHNQVPVIKVDGELLKLKEGIRVKEILLAYPHHKVIRCSSDRSALPEAFQLSCNQLYFLLPRGLALDDDSYFGLLKLAASRNPNFSMLCGTGRRAPNLPKENASTDKNDGSRYTMGRWKPALLTITEANSTSSTLHSSVEKSSSVSVK